MLAGTTPWGLKALRSAALEPAAGDVNVDAYPGAPSVRGIWLGCTLYGAKFGWSVNALYIGSAAQSSWFIAWMPRICSIVLTMLSWVS